MVSLVHVVCPHCDRTNRLPAEKLTSGGKCGVCHEPLFTGLPLELTHINFDRQVKNHQLPVVVDYWAPWCGPCKMMAPVFASVASQLEPQVRLAKVNTENEQQLASGAGIRNIPTLVVYKQGVEVARTAGAMDQQNLLAWIKSNL